jgi:hypothetical protein
MTVIRRGSGGGKIRTPQIIAQKTGEYIGEYSPNNLAQERLSQDYPK